MRYNRGRSSCRISSPSGQVNKLQTGIASRALDTTIAVVTPENIAFDYQLAGPFRRLPAYLIDLAVRGAVVVLTLLLFFLFIGLLRLGELNAFVSAGLMIGYFLLSWFYGAVLETFWNGRTVGKWMCGIRVIDVDGCPISGKRAVIRNLLRVADLAPPGVLSLLSVELPPVLVIPTGMVGLLCMIVTRRMQRLGDIAAGTMVIIDEKSWRIPVTEVEDPRAPALASFIPRDYVVSRSMAKTLAVYAERRHYLTPPRRKEIARHLTRPLIERFEFRQDVDADLLMVALYHRTFLTDPSAEPADLGPLSDASPLLKDAHREYNQDLSAGVASPPPIESEISTSREAV